MKPRHLILFVCGFMPCSALAQLDPLTIYDGQSHEYTLYVGDSGDWRLPVTAPEFVSTNQRVSVELSPSGSLRGTWKGRGEGQLYLSRSQPLDLMPYVDAASALVFLVNIERIPKRQTVLRMGCGYPCAGSADITKLLRALPQGEWVKVTMDLRCFTQQGLDATRVQTPFLMSTTGRLDLQVAYIQLEPQMRDKAAIRC